jgi:hypothetical protein
METKMLKRFLLLISTLVLINSSVLAWHDQDFRDEYARLAVVALKTLVYLSRTYKKDDEKNK